MPDFTQPVEASFITFSIIAIFVGVGIGIALVQLFKKAKLKKAKLKREKI